jgi:hypothetical protein
MFLSRDVLTALLNGITLHNDSDLGVESWRLRLNNTL